MKGQGQIERSGRSEDGEQERMGWLREFFNQFGLAWQLLWDEHIPLSTKVIPFLTLLYVISPVDLIPGTVMPGLGQVDDLVILLLGLRMFISLCPPEVVSKYMKLQMADPDGDWEAEDLAPEIIELEPDTPQEGWQSATLRPNQSGEGDQEKRGNKDF